MSLISPRQAKRLTPHASAHQQPQIYPNATLEVLKTGTRVNGTHWQATVRCTGCVGYMGGSSNRQQRLNPKGTNKLAFATSNSRVPSPGSPQSTFPIHDVFNYWQHDFATASNVQYATLVTKNGGKAKVARRGEERDGFARMIRARAGD